MQEWLHERVRYASNFIVIETTTRCATSEKLSFGQPRWQQTYILLRKWAIGCTSSMCVRRSMQVYIIPRFATPPRSLYSI
ncbi:hypothetical protein BDR03DRAFT_963693 [Suillus americanus]|nr:hypothetical protein BDR03DRAFT_963693 [Suillus americanus]